MRKVGEMLRLEALGLSRREIAQSIGVGKTAAEYLRRAKAAGIGAVPVGLGTRLELRRSRARPEGPHGVEGHHLPGPGARDWPRLPHRGDRGRGGYRAAHVRR